MQNRRIKITCESNGLMPIAELENFQGDLKTLDDDSFKKLKGSIVKYGFSFPIFVWNSNILDGHQRLKAVKSLIEEGYNLDGDLLPVDRIEAKNEKEAAEKLLLINSRYAKIDQSGFDLFVENFDLDIADLSDMLDIPEVDFSVEDDDFEGNTDPDEVPEVEETPVTKIGDIWLLGEHRLMCGDSTKIEDVERLMDGEKADMVFTDPPYGIGFKYNEYIDISGDEYESFCKKWFLILQNYSEFIVISTGWAHNKFWYEFEPTDCFYWISKNKRTGGKISHFRKVEPIFIWGKPKKIYDFDFWEQTTEIVEELKGKHTCPKPVSLICNILKGSNRKDLILDIFNGSGTTIIAAQQTGRKCYAMEISPQYVQVAIKRWQDFTGKDAVLESTGQTFTQVSEINCKRCI